MCIAPCRFRLACTALFLVVTNALELRATPIEERGDAALVERTFSALTGEPLQALEAARSVTSLSPEAKRELGERITAALERAPAQSEVYLLHARLAIDPTGLADLGPALQRTFDGRYDTYGFLNIRTIALGSIEGHEHAVSAAEEIQALIQGASDEE
ncbi:MAG TPA: hypothetical protein VK116_13450, partial [Planctomycetota bacterium]|nr:hypothetical protein [Planctomycetota bacterium]